MEETATQFLEHLQREKGFSANTIAAYRNDLLQLISFVKASAGSAPWPPKDGWKGIKAGVIVAYVGDLRAKSYSQATVARKIASVKSFFHFLQEQQLVSEDPTEGVSSPGVRRALPKTIPTAELQRLLEQPLLKDSPEARRDWAMLSLLCATGMRVTELIKLNLNDLLLDPDLSVRCIGRGFKPRFISLPSDVVMVLQEYLSTARDRFSRHMDESALFLNRRGERLTRQGFWLILKGYAKSAGIKSEITPHILRHTFATTMLQSGRLNLRELQQCLGHASITTTQVYSQLSPVDTTPALAARR